MQSAEKIMVNDNKKPVLPNPVDVHAGARLRLRRNLVGMSQGQLGAALGLTFQQIQKYERGANRISASRLSQIGQILNVPVSYFFDEMPGAAAGFSESGQTPLDDVPNAAQTLAAAEADFVQTRETLELIRAFNRITDSKQRRKVYELIKSMADE